MQVKFANLICLSSKSVQEFHVSNFLNFKAGIDEQVSK